MLTKATQAFATHGRSPSGRRKLACKPEAKTDANTADGPERLCSRRCFCNVRASGVSAGYGQFVFPFMLLLLSTKLEGIEGVKKFRALRRRLLPAECLHRLLWPL